LYSQGIVKTINVNKMIRAGCKVKIWIADWFAQLNNKMGGDLKKIQTVGRYMIEIWKAAGMNLDGVEFLWSSEEINNRAHEYWPIVMDIARKNNVKRITRYARVYVVFSIKSLLRFESLSMNIKTWLVISPLCAYYEV